MIKDWDDAYDNRGYCSNVDEIIADWESSAQRFRTAMVESGKGTLGISYGPKQRNVLDRFLPDGDVRGVVLFVHGGYWRAFDNSYFSHLAQGALAHGFAVYMPCYTLTPEVRISDITVEIARAVEHVAGDQAGPLTLVGHSAGGHLVSRMGCTDIALDQGVRDRVGRICSLSGVHDLRPMINTAMNADFQMDLSAAAAESPALCQPVTGCTFHCVVGADERPEFLRQNALLANIWTGLGADIEPTTIASRNHFTLIADLVQPDSQITNIVTGP